MSNYELIRLRPRLVHPKNQKLFKIFYHIEFCVIYMEY